MKIKIRKEDGRMKKILMTVAAMVFVAGMVALVLAQEYAAMQESPPQMQTTAEVGFKLTELGGTDSDCEMIEEVTKGRFQELIPRFAGGLFGNGNKVQVIEVDRKLLVRSPAEGNRITEEARDRFRRNPWVVRPFGAGLEQLVGQDRDGKLRLYRPYFSALTKAGSVIRGQVYSLNPADIEVILRVTPKSQGEKGNVLTFIRLNG